MKPTEVRHLVAPFLIAAVLAHLAVRLTYGSLPPLPLLAGITLLVLAAAELVLAQSLRARIQRRPGTRPVQPLVAARAVALAKASSLAGAVMGGVWAGLLGFLLPRQAWLAAAADDLPSAVVGLLSALALVAAGLWLEHCCRTPTDDDRERGRHGRSGRGPG